MNHLLVSILLLLASFIPVTGVAMASEQADNRSQTSYYVIQEPLKAVKTLDMKYDSLNRMVQFQQKWIDSIITTGLTLGALFVSIFGIVIPIYLQGKNTEKLNETVKKLNERIFEAKTEFQELYNKYRESIDQERAQINILLNIAKTSDIHKKIKLYDQLLSLDSKRFQLYVERANLQMELSRNSDYFDKNTFSNAVTDYNTALSLVIQNTDKEGEEFTCLSKGKAMASFSKYTESIALYNEAIKVNPNSAEAYLYLGHSYYNMLNYDQAIKCYTTANALSDDNPFINALSSAHLASDQEKYEEALKLFSRALSINSKSSDAYNGRGRVYLKMAQSAQKSMSHEASSRDELQRGVFNSDFIQLSYIDLIRSFSIDPLFAAPLVNLGKLFAFRGDEQSALAWYERALQVNKDFPVVYYNRARLMHSKLMYEEAISDYTSAIKLNPVHAKAIAYRCECYYKIKEIKLAFFDYCFLEYNHSGLIPCYLSKEVIDFYKNAINAIQND